MHPWFTRLLANFILNLPSFCYPQASSYAHLCQIAFLFSHFPAVPIAIVIALSRTFTTVLPSLTSWTIEMICIFEIFLHEYSVPCVVLREGCKSHVSELTEMKRVDEAWHQYGGYYLLPSVKLLYRRNQSAIDKVNLKSIIHNLRSIGCYEWLPRVLGYGASSLPPQLEFRDIATW